MLNDPLFKFDFEKHEYTYAGIPEPSVTQLLQEFGLVDYSEVPRMRLEYKRVLGIAVDRACQLLDDNNLDEEKLSKPLIPYINAYKKFREITGFEPQTDLTNTPLRSKKWRFCGSPDRQGILASKLGDEEVLIDLKCTWKLYRAVGPQLWGYKILIEENCGIKIAKLFGLQLKPSGNYVLEPYNDKTDMNDFLSCVSLHWAKRNKYEGQQRRMIDEYSIITGTEANS